jgi:hypothetical protein
VTKVADDEERDETETEDTEEDPAEDVQDCGHGEEIANLQAQLTEANARADLLGQGLFSARVGAMDLLGDPATMPYNPDLLGADDDGLRAAVLALIASDPALGKMRVTGDIDQGAREEVVAPAGLMQTLKQFV